MNPTFVKTFFADQSGTATVDWVVFASALVGLGMAAMAIVSGGMEDAPNSVATEVSNLEPLADPFADDSQRAAGEFQ